MTLTTLGHRMGGSCYNIVLYAALPSLEATRQFGREYEMHIARIHVTVLVASPSARTRTPPITRAHDDSMVRPALQSEAGSSTGRFRGVEGKGKVRIQALG